MSNNPKDVDVTVLVVEDASKPGGVWFQLQSNLGSNGELVFKNDKHPGFIVNYIIDDPKKTGTVFQAKPEDAMWVQPFDPGTNPPPCPQTPLYWAQFEATSVKKQNTQLVVRNLNEFNQLFAYSLRFSKPGYPDPILFDPIGDNRNGPVQMNSMALVAGLALVGVAVAAAVALLAD